jgi:hypothetical protein
MYFLLNQLSCDLASCNNCNECQFGNVKKRKKWWGLKKAHSDLDRPGAWLGLRQAGAKVS